MLHCMGMCSVANDHINTTATCRSGVLPLPVGPRQLFRDQITVVSDRRLKVRGTVLPRSTSSILVLMIDDP